MTQRNWLGNTGAWSDPTQWGGGLPGPTDNAGFGPTGTFTASFATTATLIAFSGGGGSQTLAIASGLMDLTGQGGNSSWSGLIAQTGGTLVVQSGSLRVNGTLNQSGGRDTIGLGANLVLAGDATIDGALAGAGQIAIGGTVTLDNNAILTVGAIAMGSTGSLLLAANQSYAGAYIPAFGSLVLGGHQIIMFGRDNFGGSRIVGPGTVAIDGSADLPDVAMFGVGATLFDAGVITVDGNFGLGSSPTDRESLVVDPGAVFDVLTDTPISSNNGGSVATGSILNNGLFEKTAGVSAAGVFTNEQAPITNNGTLRVTQGTLLLTGAGSVLGGTVDGAGTLSIGSAITFAAGVAFDVATTTIGFGATLALGGSGNNFSPTGDLFETGLNSDIALQGNSLTVEGQGALNATITGPGRISVGGLYNVAGLVVTGGTAELDDAGSVIQSGRLVLGTGTADAVTLNIDAGAVYDIDAAPAVNADDNIESSAGSKVENAGLFETTANGGGVVRVEAPFTNAATGTILVARGSVAFPQGLDNGGHGTIDGNLTIAGGLTGTGSLTLEAGAILTITGPVAAGQTITFAPGATGAELVIASPNLFAGTINQFASGEEIDFPGLVVNQLDTGVDAALLEIFNGVTLTAIPLKLQNPPGSPLLTEDGAGGRKLIATSPGTVFAGPFTGPDAGAAINTWSPDDGQPRSWFAEANWSEFGIPDEHQTASVGETVPFDLTFIGADAGAGGPVDMLDANANTTLQLSSGELSVLEGGTFSGDVEQTGGVFDSVSGYLFDGMSYSQSASGFLESDSGVLEFEGEVVTVGGTVYGGGVLEIAGGTGTLVTVPGVAMQVQEIEAADGGTLVPFAGETFSDTVILAGGVMPLFASSVTFTGRAALDATVAVTTNGTIIVAGTADDSGLTMTGPLGTLLVQGEVVQASDATNLGTGDVIDIDAGATYDVQADVNPFAGGITSAGLFEKSGGGGQTQIQEPFTSTGEVEVKTGALLFNTPSIQLGGTVGGSGALVGNGNNVITLEPGLFINVSTLTATRMVLAGNQSYGGVFSDTGSLMLQGHTLTLSDRAELAGTITGPGVVNATRSADLNGLTIQGDGVTFNAAGTVTQSSGVTLGGTSTDHVTLAIPAGDTYDDIVDAQIGGVFSTVVAGTIANAGLFEKTAGSGNSPIYAGLVNTGTVAVQHGTLTLQTAATNDGDMVVAGNLVLKAPLGADAGHAGTIDITPTGTLLANAAIGAGESIVFDPGGLVATSQLGSFAAAIKGFTPGNTIDLINTLANGASYSGDILTLTETAGNQVSPVGTIAMPGLANPDRITLANDGNSGTFIVEAPCFAAGTRIDTSRGAIAVETLRVGDDVINLQGELAKVVWLGHRRVDCRRHPRPWDACPVRVRADAFGAGQPRRDIWLSPDHGVFCDGVLIPVRYLINDATIVQEAVESITYWHVELLRHGILLAEGLPTESYLDTGNRSAFANGGLPSNHSARAEATAAALVTQ